MKQLKNVNLACVITTYSRVAEAKGQMDIIRDLWEPFVNKIDIYHEFNGDFEWYPEKYREDFLFRHKPKAHYVGASFLIDQGIKDVLNSNKDYNYIIVASADVWIYDPVKIYEIIKKCVDKDYLLASSVWFGNGLSTEFFIISPSLAKVVFPLNYHEFLESNEVAKMLHDYSHSKMVNDYLPLFKLSLVENYFTWKVIKYLKDVRKIYLIPGRRYVHFNNRYYSKDFYSSHHDLVKRKNLVSPKLKLLLSEDNLKSKAIREIINLDVN